MDDTVRVDVRTGAKQVFCPATQRFGGQEVACEICLLVKIDGKAAKPEFLAYTSQKPSRVCFAHATFEVDDCDDTCRRTFCDRHGYRLARLSQLVEVFTLARRIATRPTKKPPMDGSTGGRIQRRLKRSMVSSALALASAIMLSSVKEKASLAMFAMRSQASIACDWLWAGERAIFRISLKERNKSMSLSSFIGRKGRKQKWPPTEAGGLAYSAGSSAGLSAYNASSSQSMMRLASSKSNVYGSKTCNPRPVL